jgi:solute carrier family 35 protein F5
VVMKKRVQNEDRVNMPLFFGLVGLFNVILLWPGFIILHFTGVETFELPPTGKIWTIIVVIIPRHPCRDLFYNASNSNI